VENYFQNKNSLKRILESENIVLKKISLVVNSKKAKLIMSSQKQIIQLDE